MEEKRVREMAKKEGIGRWGKRRRKERREEETKGKRTTKEKCNRYKR